MDRTQRFLLILTLVNLVLLIALVAQRQPARAQAETAVLRGSGLELVDGAGKVRAQFTVESDGEAVFRMRDGTGAIRVKLGAGREGSGLLLLDETTEPGVQIIARRVAKKDDRATTGIRLTGAGGQRRAITP